MKERNHKAEDREVGRFGERGHKAGHRVVERIGERAHAARDREVGRFGEELQGEHYYIKKFILNYKKEWKMGVIFQIQIWTV